MLGPARDVDDAACDVGGTRNRPESKVLRRTKYALPMAYVPMAMLSLLRLHTSVSLLVFFAASIKTCQKCVRSLSADLIARWLVSRTALQQVHAPS